MGYALGDRSQRLDPVKPPATEDHEIGVRGSRDERVCGGLRRFARAARPASRSPRCPRRPPGWHRSDRARLEVIGDRLGDLAGGERSPEPSTPTTIRLGNWKAVRAIPAPSTAPCGSPRSRRSHDDAESAAGPMGSNGHAGSPRRFRRSAGEPPRGGLARSLCSSQRLGSPSGPGRATRPRSASDGHRGTPEQRVQLHRPVRTRGRRRLRERSAPRPVLPVSRPPARLREESMPTTTRLNGRVAPGGLGLTLRPYGGTSSDRGSIVGERRAPNMALGGRPVR